ncbi:MAG: hypothetical protein R3Y46_07370 [Opitutales bacterium]
MTLKTLFLLTKKNLHKIIIVFLSCISIASVVAWAYLTYDYIDYDTRRNQAESAIEERKKSAELEYEEMNAQYEKHINTLEKEEEEKKEKLEQISLAVSQKEAYLKSADSKAQIIRNLDEEIALKQSNLDSLNSEVFNLTSTKVQNEEIIKAQEVSIKSQVQEINKLDLGINERNLELGKLDAKMLSLRNLKKEKVGLESEILVLQKSLDVLDANLSKKEISQSLSSTISAKKEEISLLEKNIEALKKDYSGAVEIDKGLKENIHSLELSKLSLDKDITSRQDSLKILKEKEQALMDINISTKSSQTKLSQLKAEIAELEPQLKEYKENIVALTKEVGLNIANQDLLLKNIKELNNELQEQKQAIKMLKLQNSDLNIEKQALDKEIEEKKIYIKSLEEKITILSTQNKETK